MGTNRTIPSDLAKEEETDLRLRKTCQPKQEAMKKIETISASEKVPKVSVETERKDIHDDVQETNESPRDVTEFDVLSEGENSKTGYYNGERAFQAMKVSKADSIPTGSSNYMGDSAFQAMKVSKSDAVQTGASNRYMGDSAFQAKRVVKADSIQARASKYMGDGAFQAKRVAKADSVQTGASKYMGNSTFQAKRVAKADSIQTGTSNYSGESAFQTKRVAKVDAVQTGTSSYLGESAFQTKRVVKKNAATTGTSSYLGESMFTAKKIPKSFGFQTVRKTSRKRVSQTKQVVKHNSSQAITSSHSTESMAAAKTKPKSSDIETSSDLKESTSQAKNISRADISCHSQTAIWTMPMQCFIYYFRIMMNEPTRIPSASLWKPCEEEYLHLSLSRLDELFVP